MSGATCRDDEGVDSSMQEPAEPHVDRGAVRVTIPNFVAQLLRVRKCTPRISIYKLRVWGKGKPASFSAY